MKYINVLIVMSVFFFSCGTNKKMVKFLRNCHNSLSYHEQDEFVIISTKELKSNLAPSERLRYIGTGDEFHYFIHYYDKTVKIQTGFKVPIKQCLPLRKINYLDNYSFQKETGKYLESFFVKLSEL